MTAPTTAIDEDLFREVQAIEENWQQSDKDAETPPDPFVMVIFGATGDLARRKLIPALFALKESGLLPRQMQIIGFGRTNYDDNAFKAGLKEALNKSGSLNEGHWNDFAEHVSYMSGGYDDKASFERLSDKLTQLHQSIGLKGNLFYLATPPNAYQDIAHNLGATGLNKHMGQDGWARIVVEKPFGRDLHTAEELNSVIHAIFDESQVYRIDHYLGKETVQNIFVLRFINGIFEPLWNRKYVDNVQITVAETLGVEGRGGYYEQSGAIRDMLQSHLLQLLSLTAMEPPAQFTADKLRDEKVKVLESLRLASPDRVNNCVVRGQYSASDAQSAPVPGYRQEDGVSTTSTTETYVAAKLVIDNWRWAGVPFYLRTAKRMPEAVSEIAVQFKKAPHGLLGSDATDRPLNNVLVLRIQPDDGLALRIEVKVPGPGMKVRPVDMSFLYKDGFGGALPDAYQRLLLDAMRGDSTLFARTDEVEAAWTLITSILDAWQAENTKVLPTYPAGSWGPKEADDLLERDGFRWRTP